MAAMAFRSRAVIKRIAAMRFMSMGRSHGTPLACRDKRHAGIR
ncbi:MAG: hypothetical protein ACYC42_00130 [Lysobacter sp.]